MNKIDNLFKSKLANNGLKYSEHHWQHMESILDEPKPVVWYKRRQLVIVLLLFIGSAIGGVWLQNRQEFKSTPSAEQKQDSQHTLDGIKQKNIPATMLPSSDLEPNPIVNHNSTSISDLRLNTKNFNEDVVISDMLENTSPKLFDLPVNSLKTDKMSLRPASFSFAVNSEFPAFVPIYPMRHVQKWKLHIGASASVLNYSKVVSAQIASMKGFHEAQAAKSESGGVYLRLSYENWSLLSGINRSSLVEITNYTMDKTDWTYHTYYQLLEDEYTVTPRGTKVSLIKKRTDSVATITSEVECEACVTTFRYLNLPLLIEYKAGRNRWEFFGQLGVNFGLLRNASGYYGVDITHSGGTDIEQMQIGEIQKNEEKIAPYLIQPQANLGLKFRVNSNWNAWLSYGMSRSTNSMLTNYNQFANINHANFGIEYRLN